MTALTQREIDVVFHAAHGHGNTGIARAMHLSTDTVKTHLRRAFAKLGAHDRSHVVALAFKHGYLWFDQFGQLRHAPAAHNTKAAA